MAKRNVQKNKEVVEQAEATVQGVQEGAISNDVGTTQEAPGTTVGEPESVEKELPIQQESNNSEQTNDTESAELDSESKTETNGTKGDETDDPLTGDDPEEVYQEAKALIEKMVDEAIDESGILDEPKETTEKRNRIAQDVFEKNPTCNVLYFTADLIPFFMQSDAFRHGSLTLKNENIVTINRK